MLLQPINIISRSQRLEDNEDQTALMHRLIWDFAISICPIGIFSYGMRIILKLAVLRANSADDKLNDFFFFSYFCMKYQTLFSGKNKKNISKCCLLKFLPSMLSISNQTRQETIETYCHAMFLG